MSRSVDLFIDAQVPLAELAALLGRQPGSEVVVEPGGAGWRVRAGEISTLLSEHPYGDDGELLLSQYRYALSARLPNDVRPTATAEATWLRRIAAEIHRGPGWPVLLVHDLQYRDGAEAPGGEEAE